MRDPKTQATPGPWFAAVAGQPAPVFVCGCTATRETRCWRGDLQERWTLKECRTHAAALQMREALPLLVDALDAVHDDSSFTCLATGVQEAVVDMLAVARAALRAAGGAA